MATIAEMESAITSAIEEAAGLKGYQHGNRSKQNQDIDKLISAYLKIKQAENDSSTMCTLGRILPRT